MEIFQLERLLEQQQYILDTMRPTAKGYQAQYQKVKDIKTRIEFAEIQKERVKEKKTASNDPSRVIN